MRRQEHRASLDQPLKSREGQRIGHLVLQDQGDGLCTGEPYDADAFRAIG